MGPSGPEPNCTALQGEALSCDFPRTPSTALGRKEKGAGGAREGRREEEPGAGIVPEQIQCRPGPPASSAPGRDTLCRSEEREKQNAAEQPKLPAVE